MTKYPYIDNVTKFAESNGVSRQSMHKYLDYYEKDQKDKIPIEIRSKIEAKETSYYDDGVTSKNNLLSKESEIIEKISELEGQLDSLLTKLNDVKKKKTTNYEEEKKKIAEMIEIEKLIDDYHIQYNELYITLDKLKEEKSLLRSNTFINNRPKKIYGLRSYPYYDGEKYMVVWDEMILDETYVLTLFIKINGEYHYLKEYVAKKNECLVIISDVVFDAPLYYNIGTACYDQFNSEIIDDLTGLCELKPYNRPKTNETEG